MTTFFLDLWHDLREKRLWPVAVGLLAAIVAVPVLIFKPATGAPPVDGATANGASERLPVVNLEDGPTRGSALDVFDPKDPFRPRLDQPAQPGGGGSDSSSGGAGSGSAGGGDAAAGGGSEGAGSEGGSGGGGGAAGGGSGGGGGGGVQYFTFTVDVKFGKRGNEETRRNVKRLELLPSQENPVVVFMGVTNDAKKAVFLLIDPAFRSDGEGECHPEDSCEFVYLGLDDNEDEHTFATADGDAEYNLQLLRINREDLSSEEALGDSKPPTSASRAQAKRKRPTLFDVPLLRLRR